MKQTSVQLKDGCIKRILQDLKDIHRHPVQNISISPVENDILTLHGDVNIVQGPYSGAKIHIVLIIPPEYPYKPPAGYIIGGHPFTNKFHEHVFCDHKKNLYSICIDILSNFSDYFGNDITTSGWNPAYTLTTVLLQLCTFFAEPDFPHSTPDKDCIKLMIKQSLEFQCDKCVIMTIIESEHNNESSTIACPTLVEKLSCAFTKLSVFDNAILGYPFCVYRTKTNKLISTLIPNLISYESFASQLMIKGFEKLDLYEGVYSKAPNGEKYNHWMPMYISKANWSKNKQVIENSISIINSGTPVGSKENDFHPEMCLKVLPAIMNQMVLKMVEDKIHHSVQAIEAYCHLLRLLMAFLNEYPDLYKTIQTCVNNFINSVVHRTKKYVPDLGQFIILMTIGGFSYSSPPLKHALLEEFFTRQIFWMKNKKCFEFEGMYSIVDLNENRLQTLFDATQISNKLFVFHIKMAQTFIFKGVEEKLDARYGIPPDAVTEQFQKVILMIKNISSYANLVHQSALDIVSLYPTKQHFVNYIKHCYSRSISVGYTDS